MKVQGKHYRTIWLKDDQSTVQIIDQRWLPHQFVIEDITTCQQMGTAIKDMHLRGAPCIGAAAAYGMYLATLEAPTTDFMSYLMKRKKELSQTRPTAVDLKNTLIRITKGLENCNTKERAVTFCRQFAKNLCNESVEHCRLIGLHGLSIIEAIHQQKPNQPIHILTHCNAGWLACVDHGTATAPIYAAHDKGIPVHVWVDETRPRNQGARITAFELLEHGIPHTIIADNVGGHLMQHGQVDMVLVGSDRTTRIGDVANKIGTYLKALAAKDNEVPFYVALPHSSFDFSITNGLKEIPIEQRSAEEVATIFGKNEEGKMQRVLLIPESSPVANYAFDVTPAHLISGLITDRGICKSNEASIMELFPEYN